MIDEGINWADTGLFWGVMAGIQECWDTVRKHDQTIIMSSKQQLVPSLGHVLDFGWRHVASRSKPRKAIPMMSGISAFNEIGPGLSGEGFFSLPVYGGVKTKSLSKARSFDSD